MVSQTVVSKGIFHGLPTLPEYDGKKLSIIVTSANGISGSAMVKVFLEAPERWDNLCLVLKTTDISSLGQCRLRCCGLP
jgi:hypothetical protein